MKKLFTILFFLLSISAYSQPVMDGTFDGEAVWGAPKAIANDTAGWFSAHAKKFYVTADANYLYLGAEVTASTGWHGLLLLIQNPEVPHQIHGHGESIITIRRILTLAGFYCSRSF